MKRIIFISLVLAAACAGWLAARDRDFLTAEEIDQVRIAQEPNARIQLYLTFAQGRVAQLKQLLSRDRAGRSALVHDLLEDYTSIIEALDTVTDDALRKKADLAKGMAVVIPGQRDLLAQLKTLDEGKYTDRTRFEFVMKDAINATEDSLELAGDLEQRAREVSEQDKKREEERKAGLTPDEVKREVTEKAKQAPKKAPTLRRPGDPPPRTN